MAACNHCSVYSWWYLYGTMLSLRCNTLALVVLRCCYCYGTLLPLYVAVLSL